MNTLSIYSFACIQMGAAQFSFLSGGEDVRVRGPCSGFTNPLQQVPRGISLGPEHLAVFRIQILSFCFRLVSVAEPPVCSALALWQVALVACRLVRRRGGCDAAAERCFVAAPFLFLFFEVLARRSLRCSVV